MPTDDSQPQGSSNIVYTTSSAPRHLEVITDKWKPTKPCPTTTPEPHLLGEFPMTCYRCHLEADS